MSDRRREAGLTIKTGVKKREALIEGQVTLKDYLAELVYKFAPVALS